MKKFLVFLLLFNGLSLSSFAITDDEIKAKIPRCCTESISVARWENYIFAVVTGGYHEICDNNYLYVSSDGGKNFKTKEIKEADDCQFLHRVTFSPETKAILVAQYNYRNYEYFQSLDFGQSFSKLMD